jgi:ubiquinone/menaquinone biosynthesis C-methylase UbiE
MKKLPLPLVGLLLAVLAAVPPVPTYPQAQSVRPGINRYYENPNVQEWVATFERPGREVFDKRQQIVAATGIRPGMAVADIGAGTGLFTRLFAREVGADGRVYAVDISRPFIEHTLRTSRQQGLDNVEGILSTPTDVSLPLQSIDLAFMSDTYHHFEYPRKMMHSIHRALRPDSTLIVVDFERIAGKSSPWILGHVRVDKETVIREIEGAGFQFLEEEEFLKDNYFLRFKKR